jgi:hypothetical protein
MAVLYPEVRENIGKKQNPLQAEISKQILSK